VLCELADQPAVLEALRNHFRVAAAEWDLFRWQGIRTRAMQAFNGSAPALASAEILPCYVLPMPRTFHNLLAGVSSNMRKNVRKAYQLLDRDGHAINFRTVGAVDGRNGALESFFRLHSARAQVSEMSFKHADRFADAVNRHFITEFVGAMARQGRLRIFVLRRDRSQSAGIPGGSGIIPLLFRLRSGLAPVQHHDDVDGGNHALGDLPQAQRGKFVDQQGSIEVALETQGNHLYGRT